MAVLSINLLGFIFALLVTSGYRVSNVARTMFFMPNLIGGLILGYIWQFVFSGIFPQMGQNMGITEFFFNWLIHPTYGILAMVVVSTWQMAGYIMIIYIAGIQSVPAEIIEAANVEGASYWQRLRYVVFPLIMPSFTVCMFLSLSNSFKMYDVNLSLTKGGPSHSTEMLAMNIYNEIFVSRHFGYGQSKAVIFFFLVAIITLAQVYFSKKSEVEM